MAKLKCGNVDERGREISVGNFVRAVDHKLQAEWDETKNIGSEVGYPETALCDGAKRELGYEDRRQSDWFRGSEKDLKPLLSKRNWLYALWLGTGKEIYKRKHKVAQRAARRAIRTAKDDWFQQNVLGAEKGRNGGKLVWKCIHDIQRGRRGLVPMRTAVVGDESGDVCTTSEAQNERWRRHFSKILNVQSEFDMEEL